MAGSGEVICLCFFEKIDVPLQKKQMPMSNYLQLFTTFLKIGAFTFGGGYAMILLIENDIVSRRKWLNKEQFLDYLVLAQTVPGILAVNISILVGNALKGRRGAVVATFGTTLPSFVIILLIAIFFAHYQESMLMEKIFRAVRPVVVALIAVPVFNLAKTAKISWKTAVIPIVTALLVWWLAVSPILITLAAIVLGIVFCRYKSRTNSTNNQ